MGKISLFLFLYGFALAACQKTQKTADDSFPEALIGAWVHSFEDDTEDVKVFRPASYDFPPARGRVGFEIREGGACTYHGIAPADGSLSQAASWKWEAGNQLTIVLDGETGGGPIVMEVLSVDENMLKIAQ